MGRRPKDAGPGSLNIRLSDPGMGAPHRVGLAGLWMTLKSLEEDRSSRRRLQELGGWQCEADGVILEWKGEPAPFFQALFEYSFQLDENHLFWFPALGEPQDHFEHAVVLQEAILGSILQHGLTRKADKGAAPEGMVKGEGESWLRFHQVFRYAHQAAPFDPVKPAALSGWQLPGSAVRHVGTGAAATAMEERPGPALALRYLAVGAVYFEIRARGEDRRTRYALILPEVRDLARYASFRKRFLSYRSYDFRAGGTRDAAMRVMTELFAKGVLTSSGSVSARVMGFGTVPWASQQKTRVELFTARLASFRTREVYVLARQSFGAREVKLEGGTRFWDVPQMPDLIAENLLQGRAWWRGFADFIADATRRDHVLGIWRDRRNRAVSGIGVGEKRGLMQMVENETAFPESPEKQFVRACHEAWRRRMAQLFERAGNDGSDAKRLVDREFERLRVRFSRCKNAAAIREAVTDFWSRSGSLTQLRDAWPGVLEILNGKDWRLPKDLALLALASYPSRNHEEAEALQSTGNQEQPEEASR